MIRPDHPSLSIVRQCRLVSISRSSFYHVPRGESAENLALMMEIDRQFLETPFYGARQMTWHLRAAGRPVNVKRVRRLMRLMGLMPIYRKPRTSVPAPGHRLYPYLLRGLRITRPDQVWCADITYIPLAKGFLYLVAIMDWSSRTVLAWRLSNTMDVSFCTDRAGGGAQSPWPAGDLQHRPGQPVHLVGLHAEAEDGWRAHLHGRTWPLPRQRRFAPIPTGCHRAAMAFAEVRMHLSACLRGRP